MKTIYIHRTWVAGLFVVVTSASFAESVEPTYDFRSPMTSVAAENSLDLPRDPEDPGVGGGIDATTYFRTRLLLKIEECTSAIDKAVNRWVERHDLRIVKSERRPGDYSVHATKVDLEGLFEIKVPS